LTEQFYHRLHADLDERKKNRLLRAIKTHRASAVNLCANDYFNLRQHPKVLAAAQSAAKIYGTSSAGSPLLSGFLPCHEELLGSLLRWKKKPAGLLFNTGFMANQAVLKHLPGKNDLVLADRLIHHSMAQALTQSSARFRRYPHLDLTGLQRLLETEHSKYETVFVVTESVFSMDGDYPDLRRMADLKKQFPFVWILDEAHGTGVYGATGQGLAEEMGVGGQVDILVGTLGKSLASAGAYVLAQSPAVTDYLTNRAGELIYSTFMPPSQAGAAQAAISLLQNASEQRQTLRSLAIDLRRRLREAGWSVIQGDSPIVAVVLGDAQQTMVQRDRLLERGILVGAVRPPTVPKNTSRLRISLHTDVSATDIDLLLSVVGSC
jgi:8-amino-7-oxononanoate synthase